MKTVVISMICLTLMLNGILAKFVPLPCAIPDCGPLKSGCRYVTGPDGCPTCQVTCGCDRVCLHDCPGGYVIDSRGCQTCDCQGSPPVLDCHAWFSCPGNRYCPYKCNCKCEEAEYAKK